MSQESKTKTIRAFIAIQLPEPVRAAIHTVQTEMKSVLPVRSVAWTRPDSMHLTLRFLGGVDATRMTELSRRLRESLVGHGPVDLCCERLGCFPDLRFPRVVWAWVHDPAERLAELARCVDSAADEFAEKPADARFVGHVTLARPKQIKRAEAERLEKFVQQAVTREFGRWTCREVELIQSELSSAGSRYTTLDVFPL